MAAADEPGCRALPCAHAGEDGGAVEQQEYAVRLHSDADTATPADGCVSGRVQMSVGGFWGLVAMGDYGSGAAAVADEVAQANAEVGTWSG